MLSPKSLLCLGLWLVAVLAQREVRVDDDDGQIVYTPAASWTRDDVRSALDAGGFHMLTADAAATASFSFIGTRIEFMAPLWSEAISTRVTLDGVSVDIDLSDPNVAHTDGGPATVASAVRWRSDELQNVQHSLVISVPPGQQLAVVDMLIYYVPETTTSTSSTSSTDSTTETTGTEAAISTSEPNGPIPHGTRIGLSIALGVVCSVFGLLAISVGFFCWRRRQRRLKDQALFAKTVPDPPPFMGEVNDGITAERGRRYKSRPTAKSLAMSEASEISSGVTSPNGFRPHGQGSKLRNVVASQEPTIAVVPRTSYHQKRPSRTSSDYQSHTRSQGHMRSHSGNTSQRAPSPRKFTLEPDEQNTPYRT